MNMNMNITSETFPLAFAAMDAAAKEFWAYPGPDWQASFLALWAEENRDAALASAVSQWEAGR